MHSQLQGPNLKRKNDPTQPILSRQRLLPNVSQPNSISLRSLIIPLLPVNLLLTFPSLHERWMKQTTSHTYAACNMASCSKMHNSITNTACLEDGTQDHARWVGILIKPPHRTAARLWPWQPIPRSRFSRSVMTRTASCRTVSLVNVEDDAPVCIATIWPSSRIASFMSRTRNLPSSRFRLLFGDMTGIGIWPQLWRWAST